jgi:alpha-beta hydrolase superfamily lysophospholipase
MVDQKKSKKIFNRLQLKDKKMIEYPGMYHALSIEKGKEKVFADILAWVAVHDA